MNRIFQKLIVLCPAWKAAIDGDANVWADGYKLALVAALRDAGVTKGEEIARGIDLTRKAGKPFLPSPGGYAQACMGGDHHENHKSAAYKLVDGRKLLPAPKSDKKNALEQIGVMRGLLSGRSAPGDYADVLTADK